MTAAGSFINKPMIMSHFYGFHHMCVPNGGNRWGFVVNSVHIVNRT